MFAGKRQIAILLSGSVFRSFGTHSVHMWTGYPLNHAVLLLFSKVCRNLCDGPFRNTLPSF